jgi:hypothetical protein
VLTRAPSKPSLSSISRRRCRSRRPRDSRPASHMNNTRYVCGPFDPDPNIYVGALAFGGHVWILNRRALHDRNGEEPMGLMTFLGVSNFRRRFVTDAQSLGLYSDDAPRGVWAFELSASGYLASTLERRQRAGFGHPPRRDHHFIVRDGNDYVYDVIALKVTCVACPNDVICSISGLIEGRSPMPGHAGT